MPRWPLSDITDYLEAVARMENSARAFATFTLAHGCQWESSAFTGAYSRGMPKQCFGNAQEILFREGGIEDGLAYVEGYACSGSLSFPMATLHAWLVDPEGRVVDPTWDDPEESTYFGVLFRPDYVRRVIEAAEMPCSLLDNFHDRWDLLRSPERAEEAVLQIAPYQVMVIKP